MSEIIVRFPDFPDVPELSNSNFGEGPSLINIPGWWSGVEPRTGDEPRPDGDGDFDQDEVYSGPRYPIVVGQVRYDDQAQVFAARKPWAKLMAHRHPLTIEVESPDGIYQATVIRNGRLGWDFRSPFRAEFELPFKATDPRKYGPVQSDAAGLPVAGGGVQSPLISPFTQIGGGYSGRVELTNNGSTDTIPKLIVSGGGLTGGVQLTRIETGQRIRLEWPILVTDVVEFSPGDGQVWLNGQSPIAGYLTVAEWWTVGAGETATVQFEGLGTVTGSPTLTAEWRDADA